MSKARIRHIELLAPARDAEVGIEAVCHGADAVYIGASRFGARAQAGNDVKDIARLADFAHRFGARVYATVNTIIHDHELHDAEHLVHALWHAGVDALIVQDLGLLRLDLPPIALHASTQCDVRTAEQARFLESLGFSQLVLARELTLDEIASIASSVSVPIEAFVHGALCVSYSGRCHASQALTGRSANRGECAQVCRLPFSLVDENGRDLLPRGRHLLSLRDFNATPLLKHMIAAGASSFKIEGRLKDAQYVKNVVAHYRRRLDAIIAGDDTLARASQGSVELLFDPAPERSFNRSFTTYFLTGRTPRDGTSMASLRTPKSLGEPLGMVKRSRGKVVELDTGKTISNGDGLSYFTTAGDYCGFRVNVARGTAVEAATTQDIPRGTLVFRTADSAFARQLSRASARRTIAVTLRLRQAGKLLCVDATDERGNSVTVSRPCPSPLERAATPQGGRQQAALAKTGGTIYRADEVTTLDDVFVPASLLTQLRRDALDALDRAQRVRWQRPRRRAEDPEAKCPDTHITYAHNVANSLAKQVYLAHGAASIEPAMESTGEMPRHGTVVMTTRYCLRRELGACLKGENAAKLPAKIFLKHGSTTLQVHCRCDKCEMQITV